MVKFEMKRNDCGVLLFTIKRQDIRNAIDFDVMDALEKAIFEAERDNAIRALFITGEGNDSFCSGGDLSVFHKIYTEEDAFTMLSKMGNILYKLFTLKKPTITLLNGTTIGGGCELAAACDFRLAKKGSKIGFIQGKLGITTGWGGATMLLEKLPHDKALQFLFSAKVFSAEEAFELGFIHKILDEVHFHNEGISWTNELVSNCSTAVLEGYKTASAKKYITSNVKERMIEEIRQCSVLWGTEEHHQAVREFMNRKK